jgi:hypothetical protein
LSKRAKGHQDGVYTGRKDDEVAGETMNTNVFITYTRAGICKGTSKKEKMEAKRQN